MITSGTILKAICFNCAKEQCKGEGLTDKELELTAFERSDASRRNILSNGLSMCPVCGKRSHLGGWVTSGERDVKAKVQQMQKAP